MKRISASQELVKSPDRNLEIFTLLSHEIRTPLNAIIGISDLLQNEESQPYSKEYYRILKSTSENLLELVNNVLDYSKLNSGVLQITERRFDLKEKIKDSLHSQKVSAVSKGLEFALHFDPKIPLQVIGDQVKVAQILINLVSNSIKFTESGKVEIAISVKEESETSLLLEGKVSDTGIGIPAQHLDKIFDAFNQGEEDTNINYSGTGLGLNITRRIIGLLKGEFKVESEPGIGSCFSFFLPFKRVADENIVFQTKTKFDISSLKGKRVLLAEDNKINQLVISRYLDMWKMDYTIVQNGREALEKILETEYDVVLLDINMPVMNGLEMIERLRSFSDPKLSKLPVIALTAAADDTETRKFLFSRFDDFLSKPFNSERLSELLEVHSRR